MSADVQRVTPVRLAKLVTEVFAPVVLVSVLLVLLGWHSSGYKIKGIFLGLLAALFESLVPFAYILGGVRAGRLTDHHIGDRRQRLIPLLVGLASVIVGLVLLLVLRAPAELVAAVVSGGVGLIVAAAVNHFWKMSVHAAVAAGSSVILTLVFGPFLLLTVPVVALVAWSRVALRDHTTAQVIVGALVGALVAGGVFSALR